MGITENLKPTCEVDRHDNDHVEIKLGFHHPLEYEVDIYFFAPPTLGFSHQNSKQQFLSSLRSYVRLQTSMGLGETAERVTPERVSLEAQRLHDVLENETSLASVIVASTKCVAVAYEAYLKTRAKTHSRFVGKGAKDAGTHERLIEDLFTELRQTERLISRLRSIIEKALGPRDFPLPAGATSALDRLNEYLSYLMVDYLSSFHKHMNYFSNDFTEIRVEFGRITLSEVNVRIKIGLHIDPSASGRARSEAVCPDWFSIRAGLVSKRLEGDQRHW